VAELQGPTRDLLAAVEASVARRPPPLGDRRAQAYAVADLALALLLSGGADRDE
jgi:hypothetical protein